MNLAIQIAAGIVIAAAVIFVGMHVYLYALAPVATKAVEEVQQQVQTDVARSTAEMRAQMKAQQAARQLQAEEAKQVQLKANAARMRAEAEAARAEQETSARRAAAWVAFYKPPRKCDNPSDWDTQVECGNAHIRAQREFDVRWANGELR